MIDSARRCSKCDGEMVRGVLMSYDNAKYFPIYWMDGEPVKRSILGFQGSNLEIADRKRSETVNFRCTSCGFIESYAT